MFFAMFHPLQLSLWSISCVKFGFFFWLKDLTSDCLHVMFLAHQNLAGSEQAICSVYTVKYERTISKQLVFSEITNLVRPRSRMSFFLYVKMLLFFWIVNVHNRFCSLMLRSQPFLVLQLLLIRWMSVESNIMIQYVQQFPPLFSFVLCFTSCKLFPKLYCIKGFLIG